MVDFFTKVQEFFTNEIIYSLSLIKHKIKMIYTVFIKNL